MVDMTGLADEARAQAGRRGRTCQVQALLNHLPGEAAEVVERVLGDTLVSTTGLHRALRTRLGDDPYLPSLWSLGNHRRGNCRCGG